MRPVGKRGLFTLALACVVLAGLAVTPDVVRGHVRAVLDSPWFPAVLVGLYLVRPFLGWPITALSVLVGYKYGVLLGVPVALLGAVGSTFVAYSGTRYFEFDSGVLGWAAEESERFFSSTGDLRGTVAARVAPVPAEATSHAVGAADVPPSKYVLGTVVGEVPWAFAAVTIGHTMYLLSLEDLSFSPWLIAATAVAAAVIVAGPAYRLFRPVAGGSSSGASDDAETSPVSE